MLALCDWLYLVLGALSYNLLCYIKHITLILHCEYQEESIHQEELLHTVTLVTGPMKCRPWRTQKWTRRAPVRERWRWKARPTCLALGPWQAAESRQCQVPMALAASPQPPIPSHDQGAGAGLAGPCDWATWIRAEALRTAGLIPKREVYCRTLALSVV